MQEFPDTLTQQEARSGEASSVADMNTLLDIIPLGIFVLDRDFKVICMNRTLEEFFGLSREGAVGCDKRRFIRDRIQSIFEDGETFRSRVFATYDNNTYIENFVCHVLPGEGRQERWLEHRSQPIQQGPYQGGRIELYSDVTARVLAEQELNWISTQFMAIQEKEKARIARDLHDGLGQGVIAVKLLLESLMGSLSECPSAEAYQRQLLTIIQEVERISEELRRISFDLMPSMLEPLGLDQTMEWMAGHFASLYGLNVYYDAHGLGRKRLPPELEVSLFRVFQEGLNNIVKHAQASRVHLSLVYNHPKVIVLISDDGRGFTPESDRRSGLGLRSMEQRVAQMGGTIKIRSRPGAGSTIRVEIPVKNHVPKYKYEEDRYIRR